jgi:NADH-quinone oxidoreductase subunit N
VPRIVPFENPDFALLIPELIVLGLAQLLLVGDVLLKRARYQILTWLTLAGFSAALVVNFFYIGTNDSTFQGMFHADDFSVFINLVVLAGAILSVMTSAGYLESNAEQGSIPLAEYYTLLAFSVLGTMFVGAAGDLVMVFLGIEMSSLAVYALTGFARRRETSLEGALKYFLLGLFASAILLYGMAWIYGATGTTRLDEISTALARVVTDGGGTEASLLLAMLLLVVGLGFKIAAVPFHMWTPDAYQGAPTPVSAYMSVIPKVAGFAAMVRILVEALGPLRDEWVTLVSILAVITMFFGNIVAIAQRDVKRMLGYSSIGQTGFILAGLAAYGATAGGDRSVTSVNYYLFAYAFMNIGAFAVVTWMQNRGYGTSIDDFNGLGTRSPLAALAMTVFMLSLMGFPPLVGFYAKYYVILACIEGNLTWLAVAIVLASAVSAFFYLRVVAVMYFSEPTEQGTGQHTPLLSFGVFSMVAGTVLLGLFSGQVLDLAQHWVRAFSVAV